MDFVEQIGHLLGLVDDHPLPRLHGGEIRADERRIRAVAVELFRVEQVDPHRAGEVMRKPGGLPSAARSQEEEGFGGRLEQSRKVASHQEKNPAEEIAPDLRMGPTALGEFYIGDVELEMRADPSKRRQPPDLGRANGRMVLDCVIPVASARGFGDGSSGFRRGAFCCSTRSPRWEPVGLLLRRGYPAIS